MLDITTGLHAVLESKKKVYPQHVNRISALDDPCFRRLYYMRQAWDKATSIDDKLQGTFETGTVLEPVIERIVSEVGMAGNPRWRIVGSQTPTNDNLLKKYQISGTIDGFLQIESAIAWETVGVIDIKTASPNVYPNLNSYDDLNRYSWTKRYRGQLMLYALAHGLELCFILFVNKSNLYEMKLVEFPIDMDYLEELLHKAEIVNNAIATNEPPPGIGAIKECRQCRFLSHCAPDLQTAENGIKISEDGELEALLERRQELLANNESFKEAERAIDKLIEKGQNMACGRFLITWEKSEAHYKEQPAKPAHIQTRWERDITTT